MNQYFTKMLTISIGLIVLFCLASFRFHRDASRDLKSLKEYAQRLKDSSLQDFDHLLSRINSKVEKGGCSELASVKDCLATIGSQLHSARPNEEGKLSVPVLCHGGLFNGAVGQTGISKPGDLFSCEGPEGKAVYMLSIFTEGSWKAQALTNETTKI